MEADLRSKARSLVLSGKGILAVDESTPTIGKRLHKYGIENTEENRRDYRELFFTAPGINQYLSGCILYKETLYQESSDSRAFVDVLTQAGILIGIKVDEGLEPLKESRGESHTKGLKDLRENCLKYARQGAAFSKWRAAFTIEHGETPSKEALCINAEELAAYASISQACGLVPIVEPEILVDGAHSMGQSAAAAEAVLQEVFQKLEARNVDLQACLLKIQMIMPGSEADRASPQQIAEATLNMLSRCIPGALAGVVFLSGGQSEEEATVNLQEIVRGRQKLINRSEGGAGLTFSFGRSLQASVLDIWSRNKTAEGTHLAKTMALDLARANAQASQAQYEPPHPSRSSGTLREAFRGWS